MAAAFESELEPLMVRGVEAGAAVLLKRVRQLLTRRGDAIPGGPPSMLTGELHDAFTAKPAQKKKRSVEARVQVDDPSPAKRGEIARKAMALEFGGVDSKGRVHPPYTFLRLAVEQTQDDVEAAILAELEGEQ